MRLDINASKQPANTNDANGASRRCAVGTFNLRAFLTFYAETCFCITHCLSTGGVHLLSCIAAETCLKPESWEHIQQSVNCLGESGSPVNALLSVNKKLKNCRGKFIILLGISFQAEPVAGRYQLGAFYHIGLIWTEP